VPRFNAAVWCEKPPLMFWLMIGSFKALGVSEFAARLPAALLAIGTALATYHLARRLFSANVGFLAGLVVTSNIIFTVSARAATVDSALTFITALVMLLFAIGCRVGQDRGASAGPPVAKNGGPTSWLIAAAIGVLLGLAILAKGPIGFLLPVAVIGLFLLVMNPRNFLRAIWSMRPLTVLSAAAIVAIPWFVLVALKTDGVWVEQFFKKYNARPFSQPFLGHSGPFYYHFVVVLIGLFPWSVFLGPTVANTWRAIRARGRDMPSYLFIVCWIGVFFGFWSICSTKLPHYVLPAYPALAILTACFLDAWLQWSEAAPRYVMPTATAIFLTVGVLMLAVLPWITARYAPGEQIVALTGLALVPGGMAAMYLLIRGRRPLYLAAIAASSVMFIVTLFAWAALRIDGHQHSRPLLAAVRGDCPSAPQIAGYKYCDASTVYYADGPVAEIYEGDKLRQFVQQSPYPYIITTGDGFSDMEAQMPGQWRTVARRPRFLSRGEIVVVAPRAAAIELGRGYENPKR